jgi:hypothetical protein
MFTHSHENLHRGVKKNYAGATDPDFWTPCGEANLNNNFMHFMAGEAYAFQSPSYSSSDVHAL